MKHICQGPHCHTHETQSRIRGVKGSKVLRTRAARYDISEQSSPKHDWVMSWEYYFCDERCMNNWLAKHMTHLMNVVGINTKPQETPIVVEKETYERESFTGSKYTYTDTTIKLLNSNAVEDIVVT